MLRILHISGDFPDEFESAKTQAVRNLLEHTPRYSHWVASINRTPRPWSCEVLGNERVYSIRYFGLPLGIGHTVSMSLAARQISRDVLTHCGKVDLVHAHKLTFEGLIAKPLAEDLGVPLVATVRGNTDLKLLKYRPDLRRKIGSVCQSLSALFVVSPSVLAPLRRFFPGRMPEHTILLPNIVEAQSSPGTPPGGRRENFVTAFNLDTHKIKNFGRVVRAMHHYIESSPKPKRLDVYGSGSEATVARLERMVRDGGCEDWICFKGWVPRQRLLELLPAYSAFVLPSLSDTFGLAYVEALSQGTPVLFSDNCGIAGLFEREHELGVAVSPTDVAQISRGLSRLDKDNHRFVAQVEQRLADGLLEPLSPTAIDAVYSQAIDEVMADQGKR